MYGMVDMILEVDWDCIIVVNLKGMFLAIKVIFLFIWVNGGGGVVYISFIQGKCCQKNVLVYFIFKGVVIVMICLMGIDYVVEGIYINCICLGFIDMFMLRYGVGEYGLVDEVIVEWGCNYFIGWVGQLEEVVKIMFFLWSLDFNFIVGQALNIDGGLGSIIFQFFIYFV